MEKHATFNLPYIDPKYHIISSTEQLQNLSPFQYTESYVFVGMIDSAQISKRGNLVVNLINPATVDVDYITDKKNKGMFCFLSSDLQSSALRDIERKFEWKPVANTMTYFKSGKLIPIVITCTVHSSNSVHPPFLMCKSISILSYRGYAQIAANCNVQGLREIVTDSLINIKKLYDDPKNIFIIKDSKNVYDNVDLFRNFDLTILEDYRRELIAQNLLNERAAEEKRIMEEQLKEKEMEKKRLVEEKAREEIFLAEEKEKQEKLLAEEKANKERLLAEEMAKQEKLLAEEKAKKEKLLLEEKAKKAKLLAEEKAKQERLLAEEKAKQEKHQSEQKHASRDLNSSLKNTLSNISSAKDTSESADSKGNLEQKKAVSFQDNVPLSMMASQISSAVFTVETKNDQSKDAKKEVAVTTDDKISKQIEETRPNKNNEIGDDNFFEMDIPQFSTQAEPEISQPTLNKPKPKFVPVEDVEFISESDESDYDMMTGKRKETSKTPSLYEPALKRKKENGIEDKKPLFISEAHKENIRASEKIEEHESSSSGFLEDDDKNFYGDSVMADLDKSNDVQEKRSQPINRGKEIISNFFGNLEGKGKRNEERNEVNKKILSSLTREGQNPSGPRNMQIFSMAEDMSSQGVISATLESPPRNTRLFEKPEIIFSQPSNQQTPTKMISKGTQTPMNFFTFNLLYSQAVSSAKMGHDAMNNDISSTKKEVGKVVDPHKIDKEILKTEPKAVPAIEKIKPKKVASIAKTTINSGDIPVNKNDTTAKENVPSLPTKLQETAVKTVVSAKDNSPIKKTKMNVVLKSVQEKTLKKKTKNDVSSKKDDVQVQNVNSKQTGKVPLETSNEPEKKIQEVFTLKPNGFRSRINRLVKAPKQAVKVNCIVVGMVPFDDSIGIHKYGRITLNVIEASDYKICSKVMRYEGMIIDLTVKNTAVLADVFKVKTGEQLYEKMRNMFFCGNERKEYEFMITKDNDGGFTWIQKAFTHEDLNADSEGVYPVKRGELSLPTSVMFKDLGPSSIGTFSTNVLLVGIRCKKALGGAKYRLLVTDFTNCPSIREANVRNITALGEMQLFNVHEVFIGNDVIGESLINELQQTYGEKLNDFNFQFAIDNMYFKDLCLSHLGIVLSLKYSTKFYSNSLDIRYLTSFLLKYENGFSGSLEAMKQLRELYENYDTKISRNLLKGSIKSIQICMPYSYQDNGYVLFADKYSKEKQESLKELVTNTLDRIKHTDKLSIYDKVLEVNSLKGVLLNVTKTNVIIQLTNYQLLGAKYMSNGCIEFEVGVKGENGSFKMYILPQSNISKMFSKKENTESTHPLVYNEIMKLKFPTSPKSPIFLSSFRMPFGDDDCLAQYWVMIGFSSIW